MDSKREAARGYNPHKRGRYSQHPLMAFVADIRMVANLWLRPGNSHNAKNALAFLDDSLDKLGGKRVALLRADSGFSDNAFLHDLDQRCMHYLIALRLNQPLQRALIEETGWWALDDGIELIAFDYQAPSWENRDGWSVSGKKSRNDLIPKVRHCHYLQMIQFCSIPL